MNAVWKRLRARRTKAVLVAGILLACAGALAAEPQAFSKVGPVEVTLFQTDVEVSAYVECNRYEGKVISCKTDPSAALGEALEARLIVGITAVGIDGHVFPTDGHAGREAEFIPEVEGKRLNVAGKKKMKLSVVYVK